MGRQLSEYISESNSAFTFHAEAPRAPREIPHFPISHFLVDKADKLFFPTHCENEAAGP